MNHKTWRVILILVSMVLATRHSSLAMTPRTNFFAQFDIFGADGMGDKYEEATQSIVNGLAGVGISSNGTNKVTPGYGIRLGSLMVDEPAYDIGGSIGYIVGPQITQTITGTNVSGQTKDEIKTSFWRVFLEGARKYPLTESCLLRLGGGAGLAFGTAHETFSSSGFFSSILSNSTEDERWSGFAWEFGPSIIFPGDNEELEFGLRFAQFPKKGDSSSIAELSWTPLSLFLAYRMGGPPSDQKNLKETQSVSSGQKNAAAVSVDSDPAIKIRQFIIAGYSNLITDLNKGEGPYLVSLLDMLKVPENLHSDAIKKIHGLSEVYPNISEFADQVVVHFYNPTSRPAATLPKSSVVADPNGPKMSLKELQDFFHSLNQGTPVKLVEMTTDETWNVIYDRFDSRNFNLVLCCRAGTECQPGSGNISIWLWRLKYASK